MDDCHDCGGTGHAICAACDGRHLVLVAGRVERCGACGGQGRLPCAGCGGTGRTSGGHEPGPFPGDPLRLAKIAVLGVLSVLVGWPALRFIDFALRVLLAHLI